MDLMDGRDGVQSSFQDLCEFDHSPALKRPGYHHEVPSGLGRLSFRSHCCFGGFSTSKSWSSEIGAHSTRPSVNKTANLP
jgi:hypothetical protein